MTLRAQQSMNHFSGYRIFGTVGAVTGNEFIQLMSPLL
jgi:hypothetical protein